MGEVIDFPSLDRTKAISLKSSADCWQRGNRKAYNDFRRAVAKMIRREDIIGSAVVVVNDAGQIELLTDMGDDMCTELFRAVYDDYSKEK